MGRPYDSSSTSIHRHDLRSSGQRVRWFPYIPAGPPDLDNKCIAHKLIALGHWNDDVEVTRKGGAWAAALCRLWVLRAVCLTSS